jgi:excisionase family DNA binding protein
MTSSHDDLLRTLMVERIGSHHPSTSTVPMNAQPLAPRGTAGGKHADIQGRRLALRVEDVAALLDVGRTCLYNLIRSGELLSIKIGGSGRVLVTEVHRYLEHLSTDPTSGAAPGR